MIVERSQRRVEEGTIISDLLPTIRIAVDPVFEYIADVRFVLREIAQVERFIFADHRGGAIDRMIVVQFEGFLDGVDSSYTYPIANPVVLGRYPYHHSVWFYSTAADISANPGAESDQTTRALRERVYRHEDDLAMARFARIIGEARRHEVIIFYLEPLSRLGFALDEYQPDPALASERQRALERALTERSLKSFQVAEEG